jgi:hypothetical protein
MLGRKKINLDNVRASLATPCPYCGHEITPAELRRIDFNHVRCPKCEATFTPGKPNFLPEKEPLTCRLSGRPFFCFSAECECGRFYGDFKAGTLRNKKWRHPTGVALFLSPGCETKRASPGPLRETKRDMFATCAVRDVRAGTHVPLGHCSELTFCFQSLSHTRKHYCASGVSWPALLPLRHFISAAPKEADLLSKLLPL